jgi:nucleoside-diphosphate-sugar epimerase
MKILITGGSGFIAHWMNWTNPDKDNIHCVFQDREDYKMLWEMGRYDAIVHLAPVPVTRVMKYAQEHKCRVLYASSGAVYDQNPNYTYANMKRIGEQECEESGVDCVIARLFSFIGPHLHRHSAYELIQMAKQGKITIFGNGTAVRSYLYAEDLGRWMWKLLLDGNGTYNVGSEIPYTTLELARMIVDVIPAKIEVMNQPYMPNTNYVPNIMRALALGCEETVSLKESIKRTIE